MLVDSIIFAALGIAKKARENFFEKKLDFSKGVNHKLEMSKRAPLTSISGKHGWQGHLLHGIHKINGELRRGANKNYVYVRVELEKPVDEYPPFRSDLTKLGGGQTFVVERDEQQGQVQIKKMAGKAWVDELAEAEKEYSWYHQLQVRFGKPGYYRRNIKDREKLSETDKYGRKDTDVLRETIDLRPDHSRTIQYLLEADKKAEVEAVLADIRAKKIELFELIYARKVIYVGEHDDAGQHHDDLWHTGIAIHPTEKAGRNKSEKRRDRIPFRAYGVGVGAASWWRHQKALKDSGMNDDAIKKLADATITALEEDKSAALKQNHENPRDLRLLVELDEFVAKKLKGLDENLYVKAMSEYREWITVGYREGKLGVKKNTSATALLLQHIQALEKELDWMKKIVKKFFKALQKSKAIGFLAKLSSKASAYLRQLAEAVEISLDGPDGPTLK